MSLSLYPCTLDEANAMVKRYHRHHKPSVGHKWSGAVMQDGIIVAAYIAGRATARMTHQRLVAEVTRLVSDGTRNACSILYAAAARAAEAKGYDKIQTFILWSESGASLKAAGWILDAYPAGHPKAGEAIPHGGGTWNRPSRGGRRDDQPQEPKKMYYKIFSRRRY